MREQAFQILPAACAFAVIRGRIDCEFPGRPHSALPRRDCGRAHASAGALPLAVQVAPLGARVAHAALASAGSQGGPADWRRARARSVGRRTSARLGGGRAARARGAATRRRRRRRSPHGRAALRAGARRSRPLLFLLLSHVCCLLHLLFHLPCHTLSRSLPASLRRCCLRCFPVSTVHLLFLALLAIPLASAAARAPNALDLILAEEQVSPHSSWPSPFVGPFAARKLQNPWHTSCSQTKLSSAA
eukprot:4238046-Pleurochrysis_carterae.AAC.2